MVWCYICSMNVSAIIPLYNTPVEWTKEAIDSIAHQVTDAQLELIVVDDASKRSLADPIRDYMRTLDIPTTYHRMSKNGGRSLALNAGSKIAQGDYIFLLDADDRAHDSAIQKSIQTIEDNAAVFSDHTKFTQDLGTPIYTRKKESTLRLHGMYKGTVMDPLLHMCFVGHTQMINAEAYDEIGGFNPYFRRSQDFDFFLRLSELSEDVNLAHIPESLHDYRMHISSVSNGSKWSSLPQEVVAQALIRRGESGIVLPGRKLKPYENTFFDIMQNGSLVKVPYIDYKTDTLIGSPAAEVEEPLKEVQYVA